MTMFKVLRDFRGCNDGVTVTQFAAGDVVEISDQLAPHVKEWVVPVEAVEIENKAVVADGTHQRKPRKHAGDKEH